MTRRNAKETSTDGSGRRPVIRRRHVNEEKLGPAIIIRRRTTKHEKKTVHTKPDHITEVIPVSRWWD